MDPNNQDDEDNQTMTRRRVKKKQAQPVQRKASSSDSEEKIESVLAEDPVEEIKERVNSEEKYDLKKGLQLFIHSERKNINISTESSQKLTNVISVRTLEVTNQENQNILELNPSDSRLPIDLICIIDCSGSMQGAKIKQVKESLKILLPLLSQNDRVSLIKFSSSANQLTPLLRTTPGNFCTFNEIIDSKISASGSTKIPIALEKALHLIKTRNYKNKIVSVFLLTDGIDDMGKGAYDAIESMMEPQGHDDFTIHTFGFGNDHDSELLGKISKLKGGNFYFVEEIEKVSECFVNALGGLLSIVGQNTTLKVGLLKKPVIMKDLSDIKWHKTYGDFWQLDHQTNEYTVNLQDITNGMKRDFVIDVQIPSFKNKIPGEHSETILYAEITSRSIENDQLISIRKELTLNFLNENEESKNSEEQEISPDVLYNIFRVQVAEVLEDAVRLSDNKEYEAAIKGISQLSVKISTSSANSYPNIKKLVEQLELAKESCQPAVYKNYGKHNLINDSDVTMKQKGIRVLKKKVAQKDDSDEENENTIQRTMKRKIKKPAPPKIDPQIPPPANQVQDEEEKTGQTIQRKMLNPEHALIKDQLGVSVIQEEKKELEQSNFKE